MELLIIGNKGLLGSDLEKMAKNSGHVVIGVDRDSLDITDEKQVADFFRNHSPEVIINCAVISPGECEQDHELAFAVNVQGVKNIVFNKGKSKLIQFSSPAVFDNLPPIKNVQQGLSFVHGYKEDDVVSAKSVYGKTKIASEELLKNTNSMILRVSWVYTSCRPFGLADASCFPVNEIGRPTYSGDIWRLMEIGIFEKLVGIYHVCGPEIMSRYEQVRLSGKHIEQTYLDHDNVRPLSISKIQPFIEKYKIKLTKWPKAVKELDV